MSRTTEIRHALQAAVTHIAPEARAFAAGTKYGDGLGTFSLRILVGDPESEATVEQVDALLDDEGERSIKAALESSSDLGGVIDNLIVARNSGHRLYPTPGAAPVLGAEWLIEVL